MQLRDVTAERRRGAPPAALTAAAAAAATMTPERFQREVAERRAREGVWDGRSTPAAAARRTAERERRPSMYA